MKNFLLVANPTAQSGKNADRIASATVAFTAAGAHAALFETLPDGQTVPMLRAHLERATTLPDAVIAMGGDGTFREVAAALLELPADRRPPLGMLPTGTANDQGKSFGLEATPEALARNVEVILAGRETSLDAGLVEACAADGTVERTDAFFDSFGWGLTARVLHVRNQDREAVQELGLLRELYRDHLVYAGAFMKTFIDSYIEPDKFTAHLRVDDTHVVVSGLTDLVVQATRVFAGSFILDPRARHDDGLFELIPFVGKRDWVSKALVALDANPLREEDLNEIGIEHSKNMQGARFEIELRPEGTVPVYAQMDGEEFPTAARYRISVLPRAIRLLIP